MGFGAVHLAVLSSLLRRVLPSLSRLHTSAYNLLLPLGTDPAHTNRAHCPFSPAAEGTTRSSGRTTSPRLYYHHLHATTTQQLGPERAYT